MPGRHNVAVPRLTARLLGTGALLGVLALAGCAQPSPGPLPTPPGHGYGDLVLDVGDRFTDAFDTLYGPEDGIATITSVSQLDASPGLRLDEVFIAGDERKENFQFEPSFPPRQYDTGPLVTAAGARLLPRNEQGEMKGYELVFAYTVTEPGRLTRHGYRVEYLYQGHPHSMDVTAEITICTPDFTESDGSCPMDIPDD